MSDSGSGVCRVCGVDVAEGALCKECQEELSARKPARRDLAPIIALVTVCVGTVVLAAFLFANSQNAKSDRSGTQRDGLSEADSGGKSRGGRSAQSNAAVSSREAAQIWDSKRPPLRDRDAYLAWMQAFTNEEEHFLEQRWELSRLFIDTKELVGDRVIEAFLRTPREHFVREADLPRAYADTWLPLRYGATITDPDVVCMMTTALSPQSDHRTLEIGTGSGYQSAILSYLTEYVYTIEIIDPLAVETDALYTELSSDYPTYRNIERKSADGYYGWEEFGPFDRIIVTCAIDHVPPPLLQQLAVDGVMVIPIGPPGYQHIIKITKHIDEAGIETLLREDVYDGATVKFIPFRDESGTDYSGSEDSESGESEGETEAEFEDEPATETEAE